MGKLEDINTAVNYGNADAVAMASVLHYNHHDINSIREHCLNEANTS